MLRLIPFVRLFAALFIFSYSALAHAVDADAFLKNYKESIAGSGNTFFYESAETTAQAISVKGVVFETGNQRWDIERVVFTHPVSETDGSYSYDALELNQAIFSQEGPRRVTIEKLTMDGLTFDLAIKNNGFPTGTETSVIKNMQIFPEDDPENGFISIPQIILSGTKRLNEHGVSFEKAVIEPSQGRVFTSEGEPLDLVFDGASVTGYSRIGKTGFDIDRIEFGRLVMNTVSETGPVSMVFEGGFAENLYQWDTGAPESALIPDNDTRVELGTFSLALSGTNLLSWDGVSVFSDNDASSKTVKSELMLSNLVLDLAGVAANPAMAGQTSDLVQLGYDKLVMNVRAQGDGDLVSGEFNLDALSLDITDAGTLTFRFSGAGYTEAVAKKLATTVAATQQNENPEAMQANLLQLLAIMAPLTLNSLELEITDASLLNRIVNLQAQKTGQDPQQVAGLVAPLATIVLTQLQAPDFSASVTQAISVFMQGNRTFKVRIQPPNGLAITEILALASAAQSGAIAPQAVIERLNLTVNAE